MFRSCETLFKVSLQRSNRLSLLPMNDTGKCQPLRPVLKVICHAKALQAEKKVCYGCGAVLQTSEAALPGFVAADKYEQKRAHRQLDQLLCRRCQRLSHGEMVPGVTDLWHTTDSTKQLATPEELRAQLVHIRDLPALVVLVVDLLDCSGTFLPRLRDTVGKNPVVLVGTKADLLPKGTRLGAHALPLSPMLIGAASND